MYVRECIQCLTLLLFGYKKWCQNVIERMNKMKSFYNLKIPAIESFLICIRNDSLNMILQ